MQIQSFHIERFGRKADVFVDGIADRLNVIYGPNGSGKSTAIQFIRWMLYGNCDDTTRRFLADVDGTSSRHPSSGTAAGTLTLMENGRRRNLSRLDDGSRYGRVALDGGAHYAKQVNHLVSLLGDVSQSDFDLLFAPDLDREHGLSALLQSSLVRGIDLTSQRIPSEKVQELRLRIDDYRSEMDRLPFTSDDLSLLLDRKRSVERKIDEMEHETRRRRDDYDREFQEISRRIQDSELEIDRLRTDWHSHDEQVAGRRRELEEAWRIADQAKQEYLARRRNELADIEANIARARNMQADVQQRRDRLEATLRNAELNLDRNPQDLQETVCLVQSIAGQLDDIKTENANVADAVTPYRSAYRYHGTSASVSTSIDALRNQVGRLCDTLQQERTDDRVRAMAAELDELRQTDDAMERWVRGLIAQQHQFQRELDEAQRFGVSLVVDRARRNIDGTAPMADQDAADLHLLDDLSTGQLRAVGHACDGYEPVQPEHDSLLRRLTQQRDAAHDALQATERELRHLMDRRRDLEGALTRLSLQDLELAQRELAEVESLIRAAEERDRILREITSLEDEIARLRDAVRNSPVTQHAVKILRRLTRGRYGNIRIDNTRDVSVEDESQSMVPLEHLSRGTRDQVYLSFCLAIVTAYRKRGVELPLILNDAFTNVDSEKDDTLGAVLREFADSGQQVLVFTRHHYVANLLRNLGARFLELSAGTVRSVHTAGMEHVRFRPQSESGVTTFSDKDLPSATYEPRPSHPATRTHHTPTVRSTGTNTFALQLQAPQTAVWDDGISEHREFNSVPTHSTRRVISSGTRASEPTPFENVTFTNEVPIQSLAQSSPVVTQNPTQRISRSTPLDTTGTMDTSAASRLRAAGIVTVGDFLQLAPSTAEDQLRKWGLDARPIRRWQDQLSLRCDLIGVDVDDARLLVACGVCGVRDLADADLDVLCERISHLLSTHRTRTGSRYTLRPGSYPRDRVAGWIRSARHAWARQRNESAGHSPSAEIPPPYEIEYDPDFVYNDPRRRPNTLEQRRGNGSRARSLTGDQYEQLDVTRASEADDQEASDRSRDKRGGGGRAQRTSSRSARSTGSRRSGRTTGSTARRSQSARGSRAKNGKRGSRSGLRFYLSQSDPVVDAPTIGPKMAEKLQAIGIRTVEELVRSNAATLASELGDDRTDAATVTTWIQQAVLACRIPKLRGHDAQILVACGISDPETLAAMRPDDLWKIVRPFTKTTECKRIIRNGKMPDKDEICDWIEWAQSSRTLNAA